MDKALNILGIAWSVVAFVAAVAFFLGGEYEVWKKVKDLAEKERLNASIPAGAIIAFADAPDGDVKRDCKSVGNGWEAFSAADGRFIVGAGQLDENVYIAGRDGGEDEVILSDSQIPKHNHGLRGVMNGQPFQWGAGQYSIPAVGTNAGTASFDWNVGGGQAHNNMPPYIALTYCKKT